MAAVNARYLLIKQKTTGVDPLVDSILTPDSVESTSYKQTLAIYNSPLKKSYVEACLLASQDLVVIAGILELPLEVLDQYRRIFFDVEGFDKLSKLELIESSSNPDERGMKIWALSQGLDFISWRLGRPVSINPIEGLKEMFTLSVYKSKEALFSGNASESSKEATKWTKLSMDLARLLKAWVMDSDSARRDIELALQSVSPSFEGFDSLDDSISTEISTSVIADTSSMLDNIQGFEGLDSK